MISPKHRVVDIAEQTKHRSQNEQISDRELASAIFKKVRRIHYEARKKIHFFLIRNRWTSAAGCLLLILHKRAESSISFSMNGVKTVHIEKNLVTDDGSLIVGICQFLCEAGRKKYVLVFLF